MSSPPGTRLLMTTDTIGGVWIFAVTIARALGAAGFEVLLVTLGPRPTGAQRGMLSGCRGVLLAETDLQLEWQDPGGSDLNHAKAVFSAIEDQFAPDLVHLNSFREASFDWQVPTVVVAHSCVNSWAAACGQAEAFTGEEWKFYSSNVRAGLRKADVWVAPTSAFRDELAQRYELAATGCAIWNGVESARAITEPKLPFILSAGRVWDKAKNFSVLVGGF
jgi:Glycosyltransferase Family 4